MTPTDTVIIAITHADGRCGGRVFPLFVCLSVFSHDIMMQLGYQTWHTNVSWWVMETHLFWVKRSKVKITSQHWSLHSC